MKITGGEFRGRRLKVPSSGHVRPTQDAVREAVFSMLADVVPGSVFLDLFSGTGAVGLEAVSRGAASVMCVERDRRVAQVLAENIAAVDAADVVSVVAADVFAWLVRPASKPGSVTVVFADPPYAVEGEPDRLAEVMRLLAASGWLAPRAIFVAEQRMGAPALDAVAGWEMLTQRRYGQTRVALYRYATGVASDTIEN